MFALSSMLPSGTLREMSESVRRAFDAIQTQVQALWDVQHNIDGTHADVTASSVVTPVLKTTGRFVVGPSATPSRPAEDDTKPFFVSNTVGFIKIQTSTLAGRTVIHGLSVVGREEGDRVIIANDGNGELTLLINSPDTPPGTQFGNSVTNDVFGEFTIYTKGWVEVLYFRHRFLAEYSWYIAPVRET